MRKICYVLKILIVSEELDKTVVYFKTMQK